MITVESLRAYGANVDEGVKRCMGNESFYLKMVNMLLEMDDFEKMEKGVGTADTPLVFEAAHALKGASGNLCLTPISEPVTRLSDMLKGHTDMPLSGECDRLVAETLEQYRRLKAL